MYQHTHIAGAILFATLFARNSPTYIPYLHRLACANSHTKAVRWRNNLSETFSQNLFFAAWDKNEDYQ